MNRHDPDVQLLLRRMLLGGLASAIAVCATITIALLVLNVNLLDAATSLLASAIIALAIGAAAIWSNARRPVGGYRAQAILSAIVSLVAAVLTVALPAFALFSSSHDVSLLVLLAIFGLVIGSIVALVSFIALSDAILRLGSAARRIVAGDVSTRLRPEGVSEIRDAGNALNTVSARIEAAMVSQRVVDDERRRLIASVTNDLRGPLTTLRTAVQVVGSGINDPRMVQHSMRLVDREAASLSQLIDNLAEMDRIDAGQMSPHLRPALLATLILETLERVRSTAIERRLALHSHLDRSIPPILLDEDRIRRVLQHLLQSAIQQTPPGGTVSVELHDRETEALVNVICAGDPSNWPPGMVERAASGADGMGMALARRLVELHHGRCWVVLPPGHQAVFCFTLPKAPPVY